MADRGLFWSPVPDWSQVAIQHRALSVTALSKQAAWLVSGNLDRFLDGRGLPCIGPRETCDSGSYALCLSADRLLFVSCNGASIEPPVFGWSDGGVAITDVSDGFVLFDVVGRAAAELMGLGANYEFEAKPAGTAESALMLFAGLKVAVGRLGHGWRLHVERPHAPALWQWLQQAASAWAKPPAEA